MTGPEQLGGDRAADVAVPAGAPPAARGMREMVETALTDVEAVLRRSVEGRSVLEDVAAKLLEAGGKRERPRMLIACYLAAGGTDPTRPVQLAAAFELVHTASLIHDDITDDPTLRRRRPAPHRRYGLSRALVAGDYLFAKALDLLVGEDPRVMRTLADAAVAMAEGEHLELVRSFDSTVTMEQYMEVMEKKTASLFSASAKAGAMLAGADDATVRALGEFGRHLGIAFQIVDDVLDLEPSAAITGKPGGMDLREGRMTCVLMVALERLTPAERDIVVRLFTAQCPPQPDLDRALAHVRSTGAGGVAITMAQREVETAIASLSSAAEGHAREYLVAFAWEVVSRRA